MNTLFSIDQISNIVNTMLIPHLKTHTVFTFTGPLGAGKTTIIKEFLKQCGVNQIITSPTFGYVNTYKGHDNRAFHHFDLYRITSLEEFMHAGFAEYFNQPNTYIIIEWPEVIESFLQSHDVKPYLCSIALTYSPANMDKRAIRIIL
jgi:tRNA threonylcarbamoyladenosine biosynthesis protein TsaE